MRAQALWRMNKVPKVKKDAPAIEWDSTIFNIFYLQRSYFLTLAPKALNQ
jgi:hypothetical protein